MKNLTLLTLTLFIASTMHSQGVDSYMKKASTEKVYKLMMNDMSINFYDVCKAAEKYFETHDPNVKGSGWKGYARWKNANEYKYYPTGDRSNTDPYFAQNAYESFLENNPQQTTNYSVGASSLVYPGWKDLGPYSVDSITKHYSAGMGRIVAVYVDPNDTNKIYVGSRTGGFWKTTDEGANWKVTTDFLPATGVNAIDASPTNSDSVLINVNNARNHYSHGIYRSVNGGDTWTQTNFNPTNLGVGGLGSNWRVYKVKYHPTIPNLVFVGARDGLYRSTDNLTTWTRVIQGEINQIEFHPTDPNIMYIYDTYYFGSNQNKVITSTDAGLTFTSSTDIAGNNNASIYFSVSSDCPNCLYAASTNGIWISTDTAKNFTLLGTSTETCLGFSVNDNDTSNMIYGYVDIDRSTNGGRTWTDATRWSLRRTNGAGSGLQTSYNTSTNYVHADLQEAININGVFYVVTDGTISKSNDKGISWKNLGQGIGIRMNYKLGASQSNHFRTICGSQDNGTSIKLKDTWLEFYGADGMESLIHPLNDDWMIGSVQYGARIGTKDAGQTLGFKPRPSGESGRGKAAWEAPMTYDPNNHMRIYHFSAEIYKSDDFGETWDSLSIPTSFTGNISQSAIAENNSDIIIISRGSAIDKSVDGGITWVDIKGTLANSNIQDIAFDPKNDDIIMVVYASRQNNGEKIYKTTDGGTTWANITYNLGNMPLHSVVIDHQSASNIYIGAEIGVYTMPMNDTTWSLYNTDLPNNTIQELEIVNGSNSLKAAAWGRGLWEYTLVGRNNFPRIMTTKITDLPTDLVPLENVDQFVTSTISYANTLTSAYVEWSIDSAVFGNIISMTNTTDSTWVSNTAIPNQTHGTKIYFKVFAVGNNNDTTETYKFMYTVKEKEYCKSTGKKRIQGNITLVKLDSINNATGKTAAYTNYTSTDSTIVEIGQTYDLTVNLKTDNGNYKYYASAWIDWNQDYVFDTNERYDLGFSQNVNDGPTDLSPFSFTVPANAKSGKTRMRVASKYNSVLTNPCATGTDGETEDYSIIVAYNPDLTFTIDESTICENEKIHFAYTGDSVSSVSWTFTNGTDSVTSTNEVDSLTVPKAGIYNLKLIGVYGGINYRLDSNVVFTVHNTYSDTFYLTSCNVSDTGVNVTSYSIAGGCDSIVTTFTTLNPSYNDTINLNTCIAANAGTVVNNDTTALGCDSITTTITTLLQNHNDTINLTTCIAANAGTVVNNDTTALGCDSITTTITTLLQNHNDTINLTTCIAANAGTVINNDTTSLGCDSITTTITTLLPSSAATVNYTSCDPANVGTVYDTLSNSVGCDSIVTKITTLLPSSAATVNYTSCDPLSVGTIRDTLTNSTGCDSIITKITTLNPSYNNTVNLTSCDASQVGTVVSNDTTTLGCDSITTTITSLGTIGASITVNGLILTANPSGLTYQWLDCSNGDSPITGETNQTYTATTNGSYGVEVTDMACKDTAICYQVMNVGIVTNDFDTDITLFPNPTSGFLRVEMNGTYNLVNVRVTNELGQEVVSKTVRNSNFNVDITKHSSGVYFLHLTSNGKKAVFKVIKND